ncbi:MAG TPA: SDR family NAD(P)-dependent oxidoreductase [Acidimicrobiales bacterium]|nr:SDR family NAD(P)-dependent oxidoreductase [Acidimicrobiales bacterium]
MDLHGAVAVVTGTSSGLGHQLALDLADAGAIVVGLARRPQQQEELGAELARRSPGSRAEVADVSEVEGYVTLVKEIEARHSRIDVLVNNAAAFEPEGPPTLAGFRAVMETNFFATVGGTLTVLPGTRERGRGAVVNVSSDIARAPIPGEVTYGASKAAITSFTEALSFAEARRGVTLHVLYPAYIPRDLESAPSLGERLVVRTDAQVSALVLKALRQGRPDINAAWLPRLAPALRAVAPGLYRRFLPRATP